MGIHFETIDRVAAKLRAGEVTAEALAEGSLARIAALDGKLNAFITVTGELARDQARQADAELAAGRDRGPLHGIPVAVKDLFATAGIRTTCGSKLFEDWVPEEDATAVRRLKEAGAVLLGKTGLHELAYGNSSINPFFGAISNPWALDHDPGGSSGGSAAAVAAGLVFAALGSDTGCSIRQPAHCCGIVGFKPSFGLVSKAGALPLVWTMDHVGPLTRSVGDAAQMMTALAGYDPADPYSRETPSGGFDSAGRSLKGLRLGIVRRFFFEGRAAVITTVEAAIAALAVRGAELVELDLPDVEMAHDAAGATFVEALAIHEANLAKRPEAFSDEVRGKLDYTKRRSAADYAKAQHFRRGFTRRVEGLFEHCDVLVAPTATITAAPIAARPDDYGTHAWKNTGIFNLTGHPSISIPCGLAEARLPVGLMLTGPMHRDRQLLQCARAIEAVTDWQRPPPGLYA